MTGTISERVIDVFKRTQYLPAGKVTPESTFTELNIDSLDGLQIVFALEEEFGISIPDDAAKKFVTVQQAIDGVNLLLEAKQEQAKETAAPEMA